MNTTSKPHESQRQYNSTLAGKGALLSDTRQVLTAIDSGVDPDTVRDSAVESSLLEGKALKSRQTYWQEIHRRYISQRTTEHVATLARMVAHCDNRTAVNLVLFYEYCQADALLHDLTTECAYELYQNARLAIIKADVEAWLSGQEHDHPEIASWARSTRTRLLGNYLTTIRDFGLVEGANEKRFRKLYVPREAFVYALYDHKDRGIVGKALLQSDEWRLYLMTEDDVSFMLQDAESGGFARYRRAGSIIDLQYTYESLREAVDAITR